MKQNNKKIKKYSQNVARNLLKVSLICILNSISVFQWYLKRIDIILVPFFLLKTPLMKDFKDNLVSFKKIIKKFYKRFILRVSLLNWRFGNELRISEFLLCKLGLLCWGVLNFYLTFINKNWCYFLTENIYIILCLNLKNILFIINEKLFIFIKIVTFFKDYFQSMVRRYIFLRINLFDS